MSVKPPALPTSKCPAPQQLTALQEDDTATAILKKKKKPNQLMYAFPHTANLV